MPPAAARPAAPPTAAQNYGDDEDEATRVNILPVQQQAAVETKTNTTPAAKPASLPPRPAAPPAAKPAAPPAAKGPVLTAAPVAARPPEREDRTVVMPAGTSPNALPVAGADDDEFDALIDKLGE
jgi:hypothetical protein